MTAEELAYSVDYNKKYVLAGAAEIIENIRSLVETDTPIQVPEPLRILLRQLVGALTSEDDAAYGEAMEQIAAMVPNGIAAKTAGEPHDD